MWRERDESGKAIAYVHAFFVLFRFNMEACVVNKAETTFAGASTPGRRMCTLVYTYKLCVISLKEINKFAQATSKLVTITLDVSFRHFLNLIIDQKKKWKRDCCPRRCLQGTKYLLLLGYGVW